MGAGPETLGYEAILRFTDPPQYWTPVKEDHAPELTIKFKKNKIISAIEFRGNNQMYARLVRVEPSSEDDIGAYVASRASKTLD